MKTLTKIAYEFGVLYDVGLALIICQNGKYTTFKNNGDFRRL